MKNPNMFRNSPSETRPTRNVALRVWLTGPVLFTLFCSLPAMAVPPRTTRVAVDTTRRQRAVGEKADQNRPSRFVEGATVTSYNTTDIPILEGTDITLSENSVFIDPADPLSRVILNSNNASDWPVTTVNGANAMVSTDGGQTWSGDAFGVPDPNGGDPATAIDWHGRLFVNSLLPSVGVGVTYSDDGGVNWLDPVKVLTVGQADKNHLWVDQSEASSGYGNLYSAWTIVVDPPAVSYIEFSRSTNGGVSWTLVPQTISSGTMAGTMNQGVNIQTGPLGEVYAVWAVYDELFPDWSLGDENALGFAKSAGFGAPGTWTPAVRIPIGIRGHRWRGLHGGKTMRTNSFPSMAVNQQTGEIYVVWTNQGPPGGVPKFDLDIYMIRSTNGGASWNLPAVRINQVETGDQWLPWITCDPVTGLLACIFYDSRRFSNNDRAETFVAISKNHGQTWEDFLVSDIDWSGDGVMGFQHYYAGDYLGIASRHNRVYPVWSDDRTDNMLAYAQPFFVCPVEITGDVDKSGGIQSSDIIYLVNYVFKGGAEPLPCPASGDVNGDGVVTSADVYYLVNKVFRGGPDPLDVCPLIEAGTWMCSPLW